MGLQLNHQAILLSMYFAASEPELYEKEAIGKIELPDYVRLAHTSGLDKLDIDDNVRYDIEKLEEFLYDLNT